MKKNKLYRKIALRKETILNLNQQMQVMGGLTTLSDCCDPSGTQMWDTINTHVSCETTVLCRQCAGTKQTETTRACC